MSASISSVYSGVGPVTRTTAAGVGGRFDGLHPGDGVRVQVLRRIDARHFEVQAHQGRYLVESDLDLPLGSDIETTVVTVGSQLELQYQGARDAAREATSASAESVVAASQWVGIPRPGETSAERLVEKISGHYRVSLSPHLGVQLSAAVTGAANSALMVKAGLYLARLGLPLAAQSMMALHNAQYAGAVANLDKTTVEQSKRVDSADESVDSSSLAAQFQAALLPQGLNGPSLGRDFGENGEPGRRDSAQELLNVSDGGRAEYRYGTLPLLVHGRLREVELALFREPPGAAIRVPLHRLVMSIQTRSFGTVRISAEVLHDQLAIRIDAQSANGATHLARREGEVRQAIAQTGWQVGSLQYGGASERAASAIIEHVLLAGSVDRLL